VALNVRTTTSFIFAAMAAGANLDFTRSFLELEFELVLFLLPAMDCSVVETVSESNRFMLLVLKVLKVSGNPRVWRVLLDGCKI